MKNIHVLPTDQPSKICKVNNVLVLSKIGAITNDTKSLIRQNIYITSDENIKEGDYGVIGEIIMSYSQMHKMWNMTQGKKIIFTTDQDLIKNGVQNIDNEFLEWFINNTSCEEVDVMTDAFTVKEMSMLPIGTRNLKYKIIIPTGKHK